MKTDRVDMLEVFDSDAHVDSVPEESHENSLYAQHARFRARFREMANVMAQHPLLADQLAHSIDTLRRIADGNDKHKH